MSVKCPKCQTDNPDTQKFCGECATPLKPSMDIGATKTIETPVEEYPRGSTFADRYKIIEKLGIGGMGAVYRVEDTNIGQDIALKLIKSDIASDKKTIERFRNELKTTRMISHRNVCRMFDLAETEGTYYITMEFVPGEDLKSFIRRSGKLDIPKAISIAKEICEGLSEAHRLGVVHRDLKSCNIMIDKEGNARIMDFGIARSLRAKGVTGEGIIIGTPEYMSPEQAEAKEIDHRSDIYSIGVILYEMVTGQLPFEGDTPLSIAMKHKGEKPKDPKAMNPQIQADFNTLILNCLEKDKEKRYQSADEVRSELTNIEKGIPTTERIAPERKPLTSRETTLQFSLKKLLIPALVFMALVIAVVMVIWQPWSQREIAQLQSGKPYLAIPYFENNTGDRNLEYLRRGFSEWLITDLSQSKFINVLSGDRIFSILQKLNLVEKDRYSSEDLTKIANQSGANYLLKGGYIKVGGHFIITVMLQKPHTGEVVSSIESRCKDEAEIPEKIDELARQIKLNLDISKEQIVADVDKEASQISTSSPEAYKYYQEAREYHFKGEYRKAIGLFEKALSLDPEFALAYRSMAASYGGLGQYDYQKNFLQKAFLLKDRMPERERLIIEGDFYRLSESTLGEAIDTFNNLLELYPDDFEGHFRLGSIYVFLEEWDKAIEHLETNRKNDPKNESNYYDLTSSYMAKGMYEKARETLNSYFENFPDKSLIRRLFAQSYLYQGKYEIAHVEADKAISLNPNDYSNLLIKGDIFHFGEDLVKAEREYQKLLEMENPDAQLLGRDRLYALYLLQGKFRKAKDQVEQGIALTEEVGASMWRFRLQGFLSELYMKLGDSEKALETQNKLERNAYEEDNIFYKGFALRLKGFLYAGEGSINEARKAAEEFRGFIEKSLHRKAIREYYAIMGDIELRRGNYSRTIEYLNKVLSLFPFPYNVWGGDPTQYIEILANAYLKSGDVNKAEEEYKRITIDPMKGFLVGDLYAKSFYMLGKIYEQKGWKGKAIEHYEKFLDLWKDADPGIAEVDDAKGRLAELRGN